MIKAQLPITACTQQQRRAAAKQLQRRTGVHQPRAHLLVGEQQRHTVVDGCYRIIGRGGQNDKAVHTTYIIINACQVNRLSRHLKKIFVLGAVPLIKAGGGNHAALEGNTAAKHRFFRHRFGAAINDIVSAHPECSETTITYDYEDGHTWASYWPEVLAIFAVHTNLNSDSDVVVINAAQMQRIQDTFWAMHEITYEVEEVDTTPEPTEDDPDPEQQTDYILHITVSSKTVDELAELYNFTQDQNDILHELLSDEMRPSLLALCGGTSVADGELCWPLPGHTYISCHFGEVDAFGNAGHRGTDIPAPEGTPILAAHSGTVLVSGWNDSYGNQVLLDSGTGLSTRYAHMTAFIVTSGQTVTAGQTLGYVGSTGDSTGNHLHFEVMLNGGLTDPMLLF